MIPTTLSFETLMAQGEAFFRAIALPALVTAIVAYQFNKWMKKIRIRDALKTEFTQSIEDLNRQISDIDKKGDDYDDTMYYDLSFVDAVKQAEPVVYAGLLEETDAARAPISLAEWNNTQRHYRHSEERSMSELAIEGTDFLKKQRNRLQEGVQYLERKNGTLHCRIVRRFSRE